LAKRLQDIEIATDPSNNNTWPIYISHMPDGDGVRCECISIHDTSGILDGRYMDTGQTVTHPGVHVRVRSADYGVGWVKIKAIMEDFRSIKRTGITLDGASFVAHNVSARSSVSAQGEGGTKRRKLFAVDFAVTLEES
jgi:hypothetical protein